MVVAYPCENVPPLENGDALTRNEFERRYHAMPENLRAELIEGVVYLTTSTPFLSHAKQHAQIVYWLSNYRAFTPGIRAGSTCTVRLDRNNEPQPDAILFVDPAKGGQAEIDEEDFVAKAPEFVAEVATDDAGIDLQKKLPVYRRNEVREYVVWRVYDDAIDWFVLHGGAYEQIPADEAGIRKSENFPGLWLDSAALRRGDLPAVFQTVQLGLASPEHVQFVERLAR